MKKKILILIILVFLGFGIYKIVPSFKSKEPTKNKEYTEVEKYVEDKISKMTLREKIAQMLILYYYSDTVSDSLETTLKEVKPGGFILFGENISTYDKTVTFVKTLQKYSDVPLIISIDQEGGLVQRFKSSKDMQVTKIPPMYNVGATNDTDIAYNIGRVIAEELRVIGVNVDYAPVLDIYSNPNNKVIGDRSFSNDKDKVSSMGLSLAKGLSDNGVIPVFKHFPGHGDTEVDSHYDLPVINKTKEDLLKNELVPFINAIKNDAKIMMVGHIALPKIIGDDTPASLSYEIVTKLLKEELGYKGLVITDALNMGAVTNKYSNSEIYEMAINSGVDLLLMPGGSKPTIDLIEESVKSGRISEDKIDESVRKILEFKYLNLMEYKYLSKDYLNNKDHRDTVFNVK